MDDHTAGPRITQLRAELAQLTTRRDTLTDVLAHQPQPPAPDTLDHVRATLAHALDHGTPGERKRLIHALVHEIRITNQGDLIPVFKIPGPGTIPEPRNTPREETTMTTTATGSRNGADGGAGGTRTRDRWIMSPQL